METLQISDHKYNLRWPDYHNTIISTFRSLKAEEDFVDVTLSCEKEQYSAHKVVLSACSPYFRKLLKSNPCQHPIVILRDVTDDDMRSLLNFMYHGEVQVEEDRLKSFLRTAENLQVKGLTDHPLKEQCQKSPTSVSPCHIADQQQQEDADDYSPLLKRARHLFANNSSGPPASPPLPCRQQSPPPSSVESHYNRHNGGGSDREPWLLRPPTAASSSSPRSSGHDTSLVELTTSHLHHHQHQQQQHHKYDSNSISLTGNNKYDTSAGGDVKSSLLSRALEKSDRSGDRIDRDDDSASDDNNTTGSENDRPGSASLDGTAKSDRGGGDNDNTVHIMPPSVSTLFPPGLEALYRQAGFPPFLGLGGGGPPTSMSHHLPGPSTTHIGLQSHAANPTMGGKLEMMRVRATDPRPCPKCGKIYRSAHTLRTHMEDKHTICPGYRCVLCGTVAKSRNSLHSHMSRQHRGISTKDLPVLPMPAPFDPDLASKLLSKAGVKVSASELAARASPTAPRRSDLPKLDNSLSVHQQNQFPLPPSMPPAHLGLHRGGGGDRDHSDPEDLRVPLSSPHSHPINSFTMGHLRHQNPKDFPGLGGSALLDTYLSMIAAADGNVAAAAAAFNFQNTPAARAAAMAAAAAAAGMIPMNGKEDRYGSDREDDDGELGSDAENDDISEAEESSPPANTMMSMASVNNSDR